MALALELGGIHDPSTRRAFEVVSQQLPMRPGAWTAFPFAAGFQNFSTQYPCRYRKDSMGMVWCEGLAQCPAAKAAGSVIGTLPVGFQPLGQLEIYQPATVSVPGQQPGGIFVYSAAAGASAGQVVINQPALGAGGWVSLSSIHFLAA